MSKKATVSQSLRCTRISIYAVHSGFYEGTDLEKCHVIAIDIRLEID